MAVRELKKKAIKLHNELRSLLFLTLNLNSKNLRDLQKIEQDIGWATRKELYEQITFLEDKITKLRSHYGARAEPQDLQDLWDRAIDAKKRNRILQLGKPDIDDALFSKFHERINDWKQLPHHILLCFDPDLAIADQRRADFVLLEATLFEDMCDLYNEGMVLIEERDDMRVIKKRAALFRAAAFLSVSFVEAYLNGLAFRCARERLWKKESDYVRVTEWNKRKNRAEFQPVREKLLHYPRLLAGEEHPFIDLSKPPFADFLKGVREYRDAIAHPSPVEDPVSGQVKKLEAIILIGQNDVRRMVESSIQVVRRIEKRVKSNPWMEWLMDLDSATGLFPVEVFK